MYNVVVVAVFSFLRGRDVAQLVVSDWHAADAGLIPLCYVQVFLPESTFSANSLTCVHTPPCAIACINICAHVTDPVIHVSVRLIMQTLKHPACMVGWLARLCRSWLSPWKATRISHGRNPIETIQLYKVYKEK